MDWTPQQVREAIALQENLEALYNQRGQLQEAQRKRESKKRAEELERVQDEIAAIWEIQKTLPPTPVSPQDAYAQLIKWPEAVKAEYEEDRLHFQALPDAESAAWQIYGYLTGEYMVYELRPVLSTLMEGKDNPSQAVQDFAKLIERLVQQWHRHLISLSTRSQGNLREHCRAVALANILDHYTGLNMGMNRAKRLAEQVRSWEVLQREE